MIPILSTPWVAALSGFILGAVLIAPLIFSARLLDPEHPEFAMTIAAGGVIGGLMLALGALFAYRYAAPEGLTVFGVSLIGGFFVGLAVGGTMLVRKIYDRS